MARSSEVGKSKKEAHVVIIGGGLAGITAAFTAHSHGAKVTIIEKNSWLGGTAAHATTGINACETQMQMERNITDSREKFLMETLEYGEYANDVDLTGRMVNSSSEAISFLERELGVTWSDVIKVDGHTVPRTLRFSLKDDGIYNGGMTFIDSLVEKLKRKEGNRLVIKTSHSAESLITHKKNIVIGVTVRNDSDTEDIHALAVILATGGYGGDTSENSFLKNLTTVPAPQATLWANGDGLRMAQKIGANLLHMDKIQYQALGFTHFDANGSVIRHIAPYGLLEEGAILVNSKGRRFLNEMGNNEYIVDRMRDLPENWAYILIDNECFVNNRNDDHTSWRLVTKVVSKPYNTMGILGFDLMETIDEYQTAAQSEEEDSFGRSSFPCKFDGDIIYGKVSVAIYYTNGGVEIDSYAQVKDTEGSTIKGLYAAGEIAAGIHGDQMLEGNALLDCVVFGRIAGQNAAKFASEASKSVLTKSDSQDVQVPAATFSGSSITDFKLTLLIQLLIVIICSIRL